MNIQKGLKMKQAREGSQPGLEGEAQQVVVHGSRPEQRQHDRHLSERDFFIDNLLVQTHFIIQMIWWTGLAPWEFEFPFFR